MPRARVVDVGQPIERQLPIDLHRVDRRLRIGPRRRCSTRPASASARSRRAPASDPGTTSRRSRATAPRYATPASRPVAESSGARCAPDTARAARRSRRCVLVAPSARAADVSPARTASNAVSAASMPVRIARWMPLSRIEFMKPAGVAGDQRAVRVDARHRVPAAFGQRLRAVADHLSAREQRRRRTDAA